ncbi:hypothetical protein D9611_008885 [Ephemerocybe angulata]|uniref:CCHC-type domain-containing protein n=1 Tax=Ephemerocybe angulata TaxID=980116 RepID=A0A8H5BZ85_9AGAR|nr:hypothetical protein D9611_008885 [Tulosesus angulatus]
MSPNGPAGAAGRTDSISTATAGGISTVVTEAQRGDAWKEAEKVLKNNKVIERVEEARSMKKFIAALREYTTSKKTLTTLKQTKIYTDGTEKKNMEAIATILERLTGDNLGLNNVKWCVREEVELIRDEIREAVVEESEKARLASADNYRQLTTLIEEVKALIEEVKALKEMRTSTEATAAGPTATTYSGIVAAGIQAAAPPALIAKKAGQGRQFRYKLALDSPLLEKDKTGKELTEIIAARLKEVHPGNDIKVRAVAKVTGQPLIQIELASDKDARWLKTDQNRDSLGTLIKGTIEERTASMIIEKVPTTLDPATGIPEVEEANGYEKGDITSVRWLRAVTRRYPGQIQAHAIMHFRNAELANRAKDSRITICGAILRARKDKKELIRCRKCQLYGHIARDCKNKETTYVGHAGQQDTGRHNARPRKRDDASHAEGATTRAGTDSARNSREDATNTTRGTQRICCLATRRTTPGPG